MLAFEYVQDVVDVTLIGASPGRATDRSIGHHGVAARWLTRPIACLRSPCMTRAASPSAQKTHQTIRPAIGWREWITLPDFEGARIKAKIDTGALTSAIHAYNIKVVTHDGRDHAQFEICPLQDTTEIRVRCLAPLVDQRTIRNSGGQTEHRYVIRTLLSLGEERWPADLSLTRRDEMGFRMLLGRRAMRRRFLVDPGRSFLMGKQESS